MDNTKPTVVDELDRIRYALAGEKVGRLRAEIQALQLQITQLNLELQTAVGELKRLARQLSDKYGMKEGDSFSVETGEITKKTA